MSQELTNQNISLICTREPGGTPLGEAIRKLVLNPNKDNCSAQVELLLISAARRDHIEKIIIPAIQKKQWILCDRYWASTDAFQGKGRGLPNQQVQWINNFTTENIQPDLWILLDLPIEEKEKRSLARGAEMDTFEKQDNQFHQRVKEAYLTIAKNNPHKWCVLNALNSVEDLTKLVIQEIKKQQWLNS